MRSIHPPGVGTRGTSARPQFSQLTAPIPTIACSPTAEPGREFRTRGLLCGGGAGDRSNLAASGVSERRWILCSSGLTPSRRMVLVGIPLDVGHAMVAVVAQGRIVVVGQQLDEMVGAVPGRGNHPEGGAARPGVVQEALLGVGVGDQGSNGLGHDGAFLLQLGHDAQDLLGLIQPKLLLGYLVLEEAALGSLGLFGVAEQHLEIAGGREVPGAQGSVGGLLERPGLWLGHGDHLSGTGAGSARVFRASRIIWWVKPHSLSYQAITLTRVPSTTVVSSRSTTAARGSPTMSADTSGSSETPSTSW